MLLGKHKDKIMYLIVGGWNTLFGYLSFVLLYFLFSEVVHYLVILVVSTVLNITNAYIGYKFFVFKTKGNYIREYLRFYVIYGASIVLNFVLLPVCVELLTMSPLIAQAALMVLGIILSYLGHKHFSFKRVDMNQFARGQDGKDC